MTQPLHKRVLECIKRYRMWRPEQRVVLAVSGGLDSVAMLHLVHQTQPAHAARLEVASIDHGLRKASAQEVEFVGTIAAELELPFHQLKLELSKGPNLMAQARHERRAILCELGADRIATAHHANDQAETVLYRMLRGSGLDGVSGMHPSTPPWCKPLIELSRPELELWMREKGHSWCEDPSNPTSQRGELRRILPLLNGIQGNAVDSLSRSARLLSYDQAFVEQQTSMAWEDTYAEGFGLSKSKLRLLHPALQLRLFKKLLRDSEVPIRAQLLERLLLWRGGEGASFQLPHHASLCSAGGFFFIERLKE
jgi:tRNA(Ile)-lysidine synthase